MKIAKKLIVCSVATVIGIVITQHSDELRTSKAGMEVIGNAEGCIKNPYRCPNDVLTVGIGSTEASGQKIEQKIYSLDEIAKRWVNDIKIAEQCVNRYANGQAMPQGAFDALTSITFNVGCTTLKNSTLFKLARNGYTPQMCDQFSRWVYAGGQKLNGLIIRREKEKQLCLAR
ncbi:glycoside hydrolase [Gallibacterium salpingitidis]|uniref:Lysozyme n=1 Tax=Gallibacterium salpingitidis TaxID=505341 RepID=A0AB36E5M1_9PAST|nr:lysozyme [Gallibacterium salpingitidis]OBX09593.1 glycoside hydrolase [Gallibacterium salpingitidis]OBX10448.1 glycoside hydrolase [Gallibacterium salpingitidis]